MRAAYAMMFMLVAGGTQALACFVNTMQFEHSNLYVSSGRLRWAHSLPVDGAQQLIFTLKTT